MPVNVRKHAVTPGDEPLVIADILIFLPVTGDI